MQVVESCICVKGLKSHKMHLPILIDIRQSGTLTTFKQHLMQQVNLSVSQAERYLL